MEKDFNYFTQSLIPLIDALSQDLQAIASMLKAETDPTAAESRQTQEIKVGKGSTKSAPVKKEKPTITIEQVRAILAEKSQAGLTAQVKDLLTTFGSVKLSGIDPARYGELIEAAKALR